MAIDTALEGGFEGADRTVQEKVDDSRLVYFCDERDGYFSPELQILDIETGEKTAFRLRLDQGGLNAAASHLTKEGKRFGIWPHAVNRHPVRDVGIRNGGSHPSWVGDLRDEHMREEFGDAYQPDVLSDKVYDIKTGVITLDLPFGLINLHGMNTEQTAQAAEYSLNEQLDKGLLERDGANIIHRRALNAFYASLGLALIAGVEAGQLPDTLPTKERVIRAAVAFGIIALAGAGLSKLMTRSARLNRSAVSWADRVMSRRNEGRWLDRKGSEARRVALESAAVESDIAPEEIRA